MIDIDWIVSSIKREEYIFSEHADKERMNDNLMITEVEEAIIKGSILEVYPDDKRGYSCFNVSLF